jgi:hypothetical protein
MNMLPGDEATNAITEDHRMRISRAGQAQVRFSGEGVRERGEEDQAKSDEKNGRGHT